MRATASHLLAAPGDYVLAVATHAERTVASTSAGDVAVYDAHLTRLGGGLHAPRAAVTSVALLDDTATALSAGADGTVCVWDGRTPGGPVARLASGAAGPLNCVSALSAGRVASGGDGCVCVWDTRAGGKPVAAFTDTHDGDVTTVVASQSSADAFLSAGVDGALVLWSTASSLEEEDAFMATLNVNVSVAGAGWCADGRRAWATTGVEGVVLWDAAAAADEGAPGGAGPDADLEDVRPGAAGVGALCDYVVGCVDGGSAPFAVAVGDHAGCIALLPLVAGGGCASLGPPWPCWRAATPRLCVRWRLRGAAPSSRVARTGAWWRGRRGAAPPRHPPPRPPPTWTKRGGTADFFVCVFCFVGALFVSLECTHSRLPSPPLLTLHTRQTPPPRWPPSPRPTRAAA